MTTPRIAGRLIAAGVLAASLLACSVPDLPGLGQRGDDNAEPGDSWEEAAAGIEGIENYRDSRPDLLDQVHRTGPIEYQVLPPMGGPHNPRWQNCQGDVYDDPIASEHAVHSLEHGAVWITYRPDLPPDQVDRLADRVRGTDKLFMSPFPGLAAPISLQAWGYQLQVPDAADERIDEFIRALRVNASMEGPTAPCSGGVTTTGTVPVG